MKLNFSQIKEITTGAVRVKEENGMISLKRFTEEQEALYKLTGAHTLGYSLKNK